MKICGANARPKISPDDEPHVNSNGQASAHKPAPRTTQENKRMPACATPPLELISSHASLTLALRNAQDNLLALQRLAEQTADLHRQFLEGQEKTQQIFLKLLEQEQRLSLSILEEGRSPISAPARQPTDSARQRS